MTNSKRMAEVIANQIIESIEVFAGLSRLHPNITVHIKEIIVNILIKYL